jgi:hypothetical protein
MKVIYVAGPFTAPDSWTREQNVRRAEEVGLLIAQSGAMPMIPHANTRFFEGLQTPEFWYEGTLELLRRCDAVALVDGYASSKGTRAEIKEANDRGMPVFLPHERRGLIAWIKGDGEA